jgi:spore coat polysaccharide biosynthesis predicted glycosyltransferase SpsG
MGHLFRALTLADRLTSANLPVHFIVNYDDAALSILRSHRHPFTLIDYERLTRGWEVGLIEQLSPVAWINDRLDTEYDHVKQIKSAGLPVITFDDRGSGAELSDLNIAALVFDKDDIANLRGKHILTGVNHVVLNQAISRYRHHRCRCDSLLITLGGSDTYGVTQQVVKYLEDVTYNVTINLGPCHHYSTSFFSRLPSHFQVRHSVNCLIEEMSRHDFAITGGGLTPFEAIASGMPCLVIATESFEIAVGKALESMGCASYLGHYSQLSPQAFTQSLDIASMSHRCLQSIDTHGTQRVLDSVLSITRS